MKIWRSLGEILLCGSPNGCNNLFNALKLMLINSLILGLGQQAYLASFSLIKSVSDLVTGVVNGVAGALMPIVGVYFGERDWGSIHGVCRRAARTGGIITAAFALGAALLSGALLPEREISFSVENTVDAVVFASEKISGFCEDAGLDARQSMRVSLALEELLSVILRYCLHGGGRSYVDIRIFVAEGDAYLRFLWAGRIFDPLRWYEDNRSDPEMAESTLGVKLIAGQAKDISFRETFGANNLLVRF